MDWALARDIVVVVLGALAIIVMLALLVVALILIRLVGNLRGEVRPILRSATHTAETVRGTTSLVSNTLVSPIVRGASLVVGARTMASALFRRQKSVKE